MKRAAPVRSGSRFLRRSHYAIQGRIAIFGGVSLPKMKENKNRVFCLPSLKKPRTAFSIVV